VHFSFRPWGGVRGGCWPVCSCSRSEQGLTLPLVIVYLHDLRGIGLGDAGIALAAVGAGGVVATIVAGILVDRAGAG
jgi:hypothetical protein